MKLEICAPLGCALASWRWPSAFARCRMSEARGAKPNGEGNSVRVTQWCAAKPFVCTVPNSCLRLDNKKGEVKSITTGTLGNKAGCLNKASDRFTVKWCDVVPFDTAAPTGAP